MLLEHGEFVQNIKTGKIHWISTINHREKEVEVAMMTCKMSEEGKDMLFNKTYETIPLVDFYKEFKDVEYNKT
jgi:hypothetical protein